MHLMYPASHRPDLPVPDSPSLGVPHRAASAPGFRVCNATEEDKPPPAHKREEGVALKERTRTKKPPLYRVLLHNDDYTTKEFVVAILEGIFQRSESEAVRIMQHVHQNGVGVAGIYTYEIAETKIQKSLQLARSHEYPLQFSLEPEE